MAHQLEVDVVGEVPAGLQLKPLEQVIGSLMTRATELQLPEGTINLAFVDDETIQEMNRDYTGNDYATDVLSFNYLETGEPIEGVIGEMAISYEMAQRQAEAAGTTLAEEVALLALHGVLHISGLDHQTPAEQEHMQQLQQEIMKQADVTYREFQWKD